MLHVNCVSYCGKLKLQQTQSAFVKFSDRLFDDKLIHRFVKSSLQIKFEQYQIKIATYKSINLLIQIQTPTNLRLQIVKHGGKIGSKDI